jgi:hypothetical protein
MRSLDDLAAVGIEPPYALLASLVGVAGARVNFARGQAYHWSDDLSDPLDREQYHFDEVIFRYSSPGGGDPRVKPEGRSLLLRRPRI